MRIKNEHNHDSGKVLQFIKKARKTAVMNASSNPTIAQRTAYKDLINTVMSSPSTSAGVGLLPKPRTLAKQIHKNRKAQLGVMGNLPREWEEYVVPEMYRVTGSNQPFLILDETLYSGEKIWGFMSPTCINIAKNCSHLFVDGTFEIVNKCLFTQLWIIVGRSEPNNITIPLGYFLLPDKTAVSYRRVLRCLKELEVQGVTVFHFDFEQGQSKQ